MISQHAIQVVHPKPPLMARKNQKSSQNLKDLLATPQRDSNSNSNCDATPLNNASVSNGTQILDQSLPVQNFSSYTGANQSLEKDINNV